MRNKKEQLFNKKGRDILKKELQEENFERITASFYKYFSCDDPRFFRDTLYEVSLFQRSSTEHRLLQ